MKKFLFYSLIGSMTLLLNATPNAQAQTAPTNDQLLDQLIASATPGNDFVLSGDVWLSVEALQNYRDSMRSGKQAASTFGNRGLNVSYWQNGVVPYVLDQNLSPTQLAAFRNGCQQWANVAQLTFVSRTN